MKKIKIVTFLSLGSNLGKREDNLRRALQTLAERGVLIDRRSSLYQTEPLEVKEQPPFLNLVCQGTTALEPVELLEVCQQIEGELNSLPKKDKGPRHIDIDILFYGRKSVRTSSLQIPHPRWQDRNFVLVPLEEIAPDFRDPITGQSIAAIRNRCSDQGWVEPVCSESGNL